MFEGILEKILQSQFGEFIQGLDKDNLHIGVNFNAYFSILFKDLEWKHRLRKCCHKKRNSAEVQITF
jgi:hypothetical protein